MKKLTSFLLILFFLQFSVISQPCLPEGITFTTQTEVDNFQTNYPNCTQIEGDVEISGDGITNLNGLNCLTTIGGDLKIGDNPILLGLSGLENLVSIDGSLSIGKYISSGNPFLFDLNGINNLTTIGESLSIFDIEHLYSLSGLENLTTIGESLSINRNPNLGSFTGLENLTSIGGNLSIGRFGNYGSYHGNLALTSINALENVTSIGGDIFILGNPILTNLSGLENMDAINGGLWIGGNDSLTNLAELSNFTSVNDFLAINDNEFLSSLTGLDNVISIGGNLNIDRNPIVDLSGINNITIIGGDLILDNNDLLGHLNDISNLTMIGGDLSIGYNKSIKTLSGLDNVISIGGQIRIEENDSLSSLTGLENINAQSITDLAIRNNPSLNDCDVQSLCDYLTSPNGIVNIYNNANGCNSPVEIASACGFTMPCLPFGNYYFFSQDDLTNFQTNYPGCFQLEGDVIVVGDDIISLVGLSEITSIGGTFLLTNNSLQNLNGLENLVTVNSSLIISQNHFLTDLSGLDNLVYIGGDMDIVMNSNLMNISGLESISAIGGNLEIDANSSLINLSGLNNLTSVGIDVMIEDNDSLTSLSGLENLTSITEDLWLINNYSLTSLAGLNNLTSIGESLYIASNSALSELTSLINLTSAGQITIHINSVLTSLEGLDNITPNSINYLVIDYNSSLSSCEVASVCDYLVSPGGSITINDNAPGCNSAQEVLEACGLFPCLPEGIIFTTQAQIDSFQINYPNCTVIEGDLRISGDDITNLNGIDVLTAIWGDLWIEDNNILTNLSGLDSLTTIGGDMGIMDNSLTSLLGLDALTLISGYFFISGNHSLSSLTGFDNIENSSITDLTITYNNSLSTCEVKSVCDYLANPNGTIEIHDNATSCNSQQEVEAACELSIDELGIDFGFTISPNPFSSTTVISFKLQQNKSASIEIQNMKGQIVETIVPENGEVEINYDGSGLLPGVYFCVLKTNKGVQTKKIIKL